MEADFERLAKDLGLITADEHTSVVKSLLSIRQTLTALLQTLRGKRRAESHSSGEERKAKSE
jgi:hypothetical protein